MHYICVDTIVVNSGQCVSAISISMVLNLTLFRSSGRGILRTMLWVAVTCTTPSMQSQSSTRVVGALLPKKKNQFTSQKQSRYFLIHLNVSQTDRVYRIDYNCNHVYVEFKHKRYGKQYSNSCVFIILK